LIHSHVIYATSEIPVSSFSTSVSERDIKDHQGGKGHEKRTSLLKGAVLVDVEEKKSKNSLEVLGFQKDSSFADAFVFGKPRESIAETIGITDQIGLISVYFYVEKLPSLPDSRGTIAGEEIESKTFTVKFDCHKNPVEVWRIFYHYENENTLESTPEGKFSPPLPVEEENLKSVQ
jgi:hypothetical protein